LSPPGWGPTGVVNLLIPGAFFLPCTRGRPGGGVPAFWALPWLERCEPPPDLPRVQGRNKAPCEISCLFGRRRASGPEGRRDVARGFNPWLGRHPHPTKVPEGRREPSRQRRDAVPPGRREVLVPTGPSSPAAEVHPAPCVAAQESHRRGPDEVRGLRPACPTPCRGTDACSCAESPTAIICSPMAQFQCLFAQPWSQ